MRLSGLDLFFWVAGLVGHIMLLTVLLARGRARRFPFFTALIALNVFRTLALASTLWLGNQIAYFYAYWALTLLDQAIQFLVIYEIATHVFRPLGHWAADIRRGSLLLGAVSLGVAAALAWLAAPPRSGWQAALNVKSGLFSAALMGEIFVAMVALSVTAGLPWRTHVARIAQGLGAYSIAEILIEGAPNLLGPGHGLSVYTALAHLRMCLYLGCLLYWIVTLWQEAPVPKALSAQGRRQLLLLQARTAQHVGSLREWRR